MPFRICLFDEFPASLSNSLQQTAQASAVQLPAIATVDAKQAFDEAFDAQCYRVEMGVPVRGSEKVPPAQSVLEATVGKWFRRNQADTARTCAALGLPCPMPLTDNGITTMLTHLRGYTRNKLVSLSSEKLTKAMRSALCGHWDGMYVFSLI
jgi:hypothetical protein